MGNIHGLLPIQISPIEILRFWNRKVNFFDVIKLKIPQIMDFLEFYKIKTADEGWFDI